MYLSGNVSNSLPSVSIQSMPLDNSFLRATLVSQLQLTNFKIAFLLPFEQKIVLFRGVELISINSIVGVFETLGNLLAWQLSQIPIFTDHQITCLPTDLLVIIYIHRCLVSHKKSFSVDTTIMASNKRSIRLVNKLW